MTIVEKTGLCFSIFLMISLLVLIIFSKNGAVDYTELQKKKIVIQNKVNAVDLRNQKLESEIISLKTDMDYIKHIAKHEYDMALKDELIFKNQSVNKGKL